MGNYILLLTFKIKQSYVVLFKFVKKKRLGLFWGMGLLLRYKILKKSCLKIQAAFKILFNYSFICIISKSPVTLWVISFMVPLTL